MSNTENRPLCSGIQLPKGLRIGFVEIFKYPMVTFIYFSVPGIRDADVVEHNTDQHVQAHKAAKTLESTPISIEISMLQWYDLTVRKLRFYAVS